MNPQLPDSDYYLILKILSSIKYLALPIVCGWLFILLALLGFFRSAVEKIRPDFMLDQKKIQDDWLNRSSFTTILLPIMALTIFIFNAIAWGIYGLISIAEFIIFVLKAIWWLVLWIWNELLHPVVFFLVKLVWHYVVIWSWRFFKLSFSRIPESYAKSTYKNGFISTFIISFIIFSFYYLSSLLQQDWILIFMAFALIFAALYFSGFTLYDDEKRSFNESWINTIISRLAIMVMISILYALTIVILNISTNTTLQIPILGISFPVTQILTIIFIIAFASSLLSNAMFPAYMASTNGNFIIEDFLLNAVKRLPRFIGAVPFVILGGIVASIATIIIGSFLWWSTNSIKHHYSENAIENMTVELNEVKSDFNKFYNNVNHSDNANNYPDKAFKQIAKLESRIYSLNLVKHSWSDFLINISSGLRDRDLERDNLALLQSNYNEHKKLIMNEVAESEKFLNELNAEKATSSDTASLAQVIKTEKERMSNLKLELVKQEAQFILNRKLSEARIKSINTYNIMWIIGTFFALFGFALLSAIALTPYWVLRTKVFFDLYDYYHKGNSYFHEQVRYYKQKNENQPLLGLFVFLSLAGIFIALKFIL
ncbi:MAG: hypothetical protein R6V23_00795 [Bacteroidales bacterium]